MAPIRQSKNELAPRKKKILNALARKIDAGESASIRARGRAAFARHEQLRSIVQALKARRLSRSISLAVLARKTGIAKPNLSRLENNRHAVPTFDTLERYARALGLTLRIELAAADAA
jgi:DNA-binding Xre family transcriptional regulator